MGGAEKNRQRGQGGRDGGRVRRAPKDHTALDEASSVAVLCNSNPNCQAFNVAYCPRNQDLTVSSCLHSSTN